MSIVERGLLPRPVTTVATAGRVWSLWVLPAVGGCCGTDARHVQAIADAFLADTGA